MEGDKVLKFGAAQIANPTPKALTYIFRTYNFLAGLWAIIYLAKVVRMPLEDAIYLNTIILLGSPIIQYTIKFFGWDDREARY